MKFKELLRNKTKNIYENKSPCIAFLGDSITQGCFEVYMTGKDSLETVFDSANAYHSKLKQMLAVVYPNVPVNVVNAGISGDSTTNALKRLDRDVLCHKPDLVVVCFGLNDCHKGVDGLDIYISNLSQIFQEIQLSGSEVIFMTPNMMNTGVSCHIKDEFLRNLAFDFAKVQNDRILEAYADGALALCKKENIPVCDCYHKWKKLHENGADITDLLANYLNHPTREMHWLFANALFDMILL